MCFGLVGFFLLRCRCMLGCFVSVHSLLAGVKYLPDNGFVRHIHGIILSTLAPGDRVTKTDNFLHQFFGLTLVVGTHAVPSGGGSLNSVTGTVCIYNDDIVMYRLHCACTTFRKG